MTIIIYDQLDASIKFYVAEGDLHHLDGVYINQADDNEVKEAQLLDLLDTLEPYDKFPTQYLDPSVTVITCGFLP
jgi:hypothetical protein